ncbi:3'-5' exonuclease [Streptomyces sp. SPB4]|uniref:3'-5' exonuclease n=1 Tax=Streptomyces sp. SPB4 TaxID=2940553 RepID=UPI0024761690|nr:3'-5' exonuclease [Streptomyces sp. SPB4]MDH6544939.1 DNA polymerase III epsilon subunit-like protein [Streptomyces sp. SPB4]
MTDTHTETAASPETIPQEQSWPESLGARRLAGMLAETTGQPVTAADIDELVAREHLVAVDSYKGWPLYATAAARELDVDLITSIVAARVAWFEVSLNQDAAVERIGWHWRDLARMAREGRITVGPGDRYRITDLDTLAAEAEDEQHVTAQTAADILEIRPTDWKYVEAAGWIEPADTYEREVGRYRTVTVVLYRLGDVRDLREMPGVDWEAARGLGKGAPSPLREYAKLAPTRAGAVKAFAQQLADRHATTVWAWHSPYSGGWELDWERVEGIPTKETVREELAADPVVGPYADEITLCPLWGRITRRARRLLEPDAAVIVDTETTDLYGQTIELAVIDAATGKVLQDTLVKPTEPISAGARYVHGLSDEDVAGARPFEKVLPRLRKVTKDRVICAYNAGFDRAVILGDTRRAGKKPLHLEPRETWYCLMEAYASWLGSRRWLALGGGHRAVGDCAAARDVLVRISKGRGSTFTPRPAAPGDPVAGPPAGSVFMV